MKVQLKNKNYFVRVYHEKCKNTHNARSNNKIQVITTVVIENAFGEEIGVGRSFCLEGDQFVKKTGVKIALTRALEDVSPSFNKEERTEFWNVVLGRKGHHKEETYDVELVEDEVVYKQTKLSALHIIGMIFMLLCAVYLLINYV